MNGLRRLIVPGAADCEIADSPRGQAPLPGTELRSGERIFVAQPARTLDVLALGHAGEGQTFYDVWVELAALAARHALWRSGARALGLVYDPWSLSEGGDTRYDACIALPSGLTATFEGDVPGLRIQRLSLGWSWLARYEGALPARAALYRDAFTTSAFEAEGLVAPSPRSPACERYAFVPTDPAAPNRVEVFLAP